MSSHNILTYGLILFLLTQGNFMPGSWEDFLNVFTIYGHVSHLEHVEQTHFPDHCKLHLKFHFSCRGLKLLEYA